jgi:hypothetical protein
VPSLPYFSTGGFGVHCEITGMCSKRLCLHVEQRVSGAEEGGSQVMRNTENFFMLCFVFFTVGCRARGHITIALIKCDVAIEHQIPYKSKF